MRFNIIDNVLSIKGKVLIPDPTALSGRRLVVVQGASEQNHNARDKLGRPIQIRSYVRGVATRTLKQSARRNKMTRSVMAWRQVTEVEKNALKSEADKKAITVYMAFVSKYMREAKQAGASSWNNEATRWNNDDVFWNGV